MSQTRESPKRVLMRQFEMLIQNSDNKNSGFRVYLDQGNIFKWRIVIDGPKDTPYEGGQFTALLKFPPSFPHYPPKMTFLTDILHPNVDSRNGQVCISILHPPGNDPMGYEQASERWNRDRSVESIVVSVQLLLAEPNFDSPANVDAAVLYRRDPTMYFREVRRRVQAAKPPRASASSPDIPNSPQQNERSDASGTDGSSHGSEAEGANTATTADTQ